MTIDVRTSEKIKMCGITLPLHTGIYKQVLEAVALQGSLLEFVSAELRADPEIVLAAVKDDGKALKFVTDAKMPRYDEIVQAAIAQHPFAKRYALKSTSR